MASSSSSPEPPAATIPDPTHTQTQFSYKDATFDEVLEDLSTRFILNLPDEELSSIERLCFQVEQAHWYYEDFMREENPSLPSLALKRFSAKLFAACPLLQDWSADHEAAFNNFMQYKTLVPVCGAIMLNDAMDKCVLVKGWKASSGWGFPKGKINETEAPHMCAIREVLEETGFNLATMIDPENVVETTIKGQRISLFIVPSVPEDYPFKTKTRKEISKIEWFKLADLPTWKRNKSSPGRFYLISPFIVPLKSFIHSQRRIQKGKSAKGRKSGTSEDTRVANKKSTNMRGSSRVPEGSHTASLTGGHGHEDDHSEIMSSAPTNRNGLDMQALDPQLARLLSGLTLSQQRTDINEISTSSSIISDVAKTPVPASRAVKDSSTSAGPNSDRPDRAHPSNNLTSPPSFSNGSHTSPLNATSASANATLLSNNPQEPNLNNYNNRNLQASSAVVSPTSPKSSQLNARRGSATADISPYLSRSSEVPTSARTLQQLSLLESVANESERMASVLTARASNAPQMGTRMDLPPPPSSVPPHAMFPPDRRPFSVVDPASIHTVMPHGGNFHPVYPNGPPLLPQQYDPYQVRSRTSQAFHRTPTHHPSGSVNLNGSIPYGKPSHPPTELFSSHYAYPPPQPPMYNPRLNPGLNDIRPGYPLMPIGGLVHPPPPNMTLGSNMPPPPGMRLSPHPPNASAMTLLSILNGAPQQPSQ